MTTATTEFTHTVTSAGPAQGMTSSPAERRLPDAPAVAGDVPLIIAVHGGTYTSLHFHIPDIRCWIRLLYSGIPIVAVDRPGYRGSSPVAAIGLDHFEERRSALYHLRANSGRRGAKARRGPSSSLTRIGGAATTGWLGAREIPAGRCSASHCPDALPEVPAQFRDAFNELPEHRTYRPPHSDEATG